MALPDTQPVPGQRWASESEPELGLGVILSVGSGRVEILFAAAEERRHYALASAPLRRVAFKAGDTIRTHDGAELVVDEVRDLDRLLEYESGGRSVPEAELADTISFSAPEERLLAGAVDPVDDFELRREALEVAGRIRGSDVRGFVGPRIDLIPHQLSIAGEVAARLAPRVLLADEVGLGKTIEAGLILHRLHLSGRASRVLILVPEPLVHQWFVELYRRFNLAFAIFDEERCASIERLEPDANPFLDDQLVLAGVGLLADDPKRARQAMEAGWDLLIVDEAHHLEWTPEHEGPGYQVVSGLAAITPGLLLLTATPQQRGAAGHFARLRLLDPDRYSDFEEFQEEARHYERVAGIIERVSDGGSLTADDFDFLDAHSPRVGRQARAMRGGDDASRDRFVAELLDSFGTGRVMFRNTRAAIPGFPERRSHLVPLEGNDRTAAKVKWLASLLRNLGEEEKVLLICRTRGLAEQIQGRLQHEMSVSAALFHEDLTLVQRDRNAAWFADEEGARILICSEIGSEGRNFQFSHHLVLFDLPNDPELLEQRIGRLDRIGQRSTVEIHVPYMVGTSEAVLAQWYEQGLDAFEHPLHGASEIARAVADTLAALLNNYDARGVDELIDRSKRARAEVTARLTKGYDRLLELNSNRPGRADSITQGIIAAESDPSFERFIVRLLEHFGVQVDEIADRTYVLREGELLTDEFPQLPSGGIAATFDRRRALARDDVWFLTQDHPFVRDVLDLFLESGSGNATIAVQSDSDREEMLLELVAVVEVIAPAELDVERFLAPRPVRVVVDGRGQDRTSSNWIDESDLRTGDPEDLVDVDYGGPELLPTMIDAAVAAAAERMMVIVAEATKQLDEELQREIDRLSDLAEINPNVQRGEIEALDRHREEIRNAIDAARLRAAAMCLVVLRE